MENKTMNKIAVFSPCDDIDENGCGSVWHMKDGPELNEEFHCTCIYKMLSTVELFELLFNGETINIENERLLKYCKSVE